MRITLNMDGSVRMEPTDAEDTEVIAILVSELVKGGVATYRKSNKVKQHIEERNA